MKYDLSIVILSYNTKGLLRDLLQSVIISKHNGYQVETIVVDNASHDGSIEMMKKQFSKIKLLINKENLGFSKGNNKGIKIAQGRYLLFLNSDTLLEKDTLFKMIKFMDSHLQYAAATCRVELPNGDLDLACHRGFPTPWAAFTYFSGLEKIFPHSRIFSQYHQGWSNLNKTHEIEVISGAFFMVRKKTLDRVGYFDERFFMYGEDIDLCFRINTVGQKICFYADTKIIHHKKQSGRQRNLNNKVVQRDLEIRLKSKSDFYHTMKIFYDKHYKKKYPASLKHLILLGIWIVSKFRD